MLSPRYVGAADAVYSGRRLSHAESLAVAGVGEVVASHAEGMCPLRRWRTAEGIWVRKRWPRHVPRWSRSKSGSRWDSRPVAARLSQNGYFKFEVRMDAPCRVGGYGIHAYPVIIVDEAFSPVVRAESLLSLLAFGRAGGLVCSLRFSAACMRKRFVEHLQGFMLLDRRLRFVA
ncbi:hypothetical protein EDB89DRAFT_1022095 [Lactarius sanguifluus]|nr:hypothetical protein EDB89DRAFT_1022095 [Lactarius sanguifluus]